MDETRSERLYDTLNWKDPRHFDVAFPFPFCPMILHIHTRIYIFQERNRLQSCVLIWVFWMTWKGTKTAPSLAVCVFSSIESREFPSLFGRSLILQQLLKRVCCCCSIFCMPNDVWYVAGQQHTDQGSLAFLLPAQHIQKRMDDVVCLLCSFFRASGGGGVGRGCIERAN